MPPQRLPIVNSDDGTWGDILRQYLQKEHYDDGTNNAANGGHKTITIRAGTAAANTAPLKFTSGTLLATPEAGAVEFYNDTLYFTQPTGPTRTQIITNSNTQTLTNKTISGSSNTFSNIPQSAVTNLATDLSNKADASHKYHTFTDGDYYFDSYTQAKNLRLFTENSTYSATRFKTPVEVEYHNGTSWVAWVGGDSVVKELLDGREETQSTIDHAHRRFRFKLSGQSYPTQTLWVIQTHWTAISFPNVAMKVSTASTQGGTYTLRDTATFNPANGSTSWGISMYATSALHTNETWYQIEIDWTDWTDSGAYVGLPMRRIEILSNYQGGDLLPFSWNWNRHLSGLRKVIFPASTATDVGIEFGSDTNLYRSAADQLKTDDNLIVGTPGTVAGSVVTIDGTQTLTSKTLSSPTFSGSYSFGGTPTWPTFNQNTTGSAATLTTTRTLQANLSSTTPANFNGSANASIGVTGTLPVSNGGTGRATSTTAYGIIAAGTTATGAQQTISPGAAGHFLKSAGAGAYASFAAITAADITGTTAQFNTALSDGDFATLTGTETLTGKTINLASNTLTGTTAQFNTALSDGDFATTADMANKADVNVYGGTQVLKGITTYPDPENSNFTLLAPLFNDLAYNTERGGFIAVTKNGSTHTSSVIDRVFRPDAGYWSSGAAASSDVFVLTVTPWRTFDYGNAYGIAFAASFRAQDVKIEVYYSGSWTEIYNVTGSSSPIHRVHYGSNSSNDVTSIRYTITNPSSTTTGIRLSSLFVIPRDSKLLSAGYMGLEGGLMYGDISRSVDPTSANHLSRKAYVDAGLATKADTSHAHAATDISDSTSTGRAVLTATDAAAARTAIGAGTGSGDVTLAGAQTLANKTLDSPIITSPQISTAIYDSNWNQVLDLVGIGSAVNHYYITNQSTGNYPTIGVDGMDSNIGIAIAPKGNGTVRIYATAGQTPTIDVAGPDTDLDLNLVSKGSGTVQANGVEVVGISNSQVLTNKTISGASNTITDIPYDAIAGATNLLTTNPSFDSDLAGWTPVNGGSWSHDSGTGHKSNGSASKTLSGVGIDFESPAVSVSPSTTYSVGVWVKGTSLTGPDGAIRLQLRTYNGGSPTGWVDLAGTELYEDNVNNGSKYWSTLYGVEGSFDWVYLHGQITIPPTGIDGIAANVFVFEGVTSGTVYVDDAFIGMPHVNPSSVQGLGNAINGLAWYPQQLENKRIVSRVGTIDSAAEPEINIDAIDTFKITALATNISSMTTNLIGTPTDRQRLLISIKDDGTPRTITWGSAFQASGSATPLATTIANRTHHVGFVYDDSISKWVCLAVDPTGY